MIYLYVYLIVSFVVALFFNGLSYIAASPHTRARMTVWDHIVAGVLVQILFMITWPYFLVCFILDHVSRS